MLGLQLQVYAPHLPFYGDGNQAQGLVHAGKAVHCPVTSSAPGYISSNLFLHQTILGWGVQETNRHEDFCATDY